MKFSWKVNMKIGLYCLSEVMVSRVRSASLTELNCFLSFFTESWVELSAHPTSSNSPDRVTPLPFNTGEEYLKLLREAQRESNQSSARVSVASSRRDSPRESPKSPPNSPNTELSTDDDLKGVYINYCYKVRHNYLILKSSIFFN
ncbi:hypothetical protein C0J52_08241 [Blattella germanica]|nr:hypothetical protein C0J52_08241 [Blattella germanica]